MLEVLRVTNPQSSIELALEAQFQDGSMGELAARAAEAESLDDWFAEPLPPGYVVISTVDALRRTIYSLRFPPDAYERPRLCATDMRLVLAEAWDHYYTRWPDGVTPEMLERLVHEPPAPACHVRRTMWDLALHHAATATAAQAGKLIVDDRSRSAAEREAALAFVQEVHATSGSMAAIRMGRLAHLIGAWDDEDPMGASTMFYEDMYTVLPWIALFSRYMNEVDPKAGRWWGDVSNRSAVPPKSPEKAERRLTAAVERAWAATLMMAQSCGVELFVEEEGEGSLELAQRAVLEVSHATERIDSLGLASRSTTSLYDAFRWAKRVLRKDSSRLMKILGGQFLKFGFVPRPPGPEQ